MDGKCFPSLGGHRSPSFLAVTDPLSLGSFFTRVSTPFSSEFMRRSLKCFKTLLVFFMLFLFVYIDVDECTASPSVCDVNANCSNTRGSFSCTCKTGFSGDGKNCKGEDATNFKVV